MQLRNPFPLEVRNLFLYNYECFWCGGNGNGRGGMELHHIWGRISASALNAAPLCKVCHAGMIHTIPEQQRLLKRTIRFLRGEQYKLRPVDHEFLELVKTDLRGFAVDATIPE